MEYIWLTKVILAHLLTDFLLQSPLWITDRKQKHFASPYLYVHGTITALLAWALMGWEFWMIALVIFVTHVLIDGWKSYRKSTVTFFLADQALHLAVILICWYLSFYDWSDITERWEELNTDTDLWVIITAFVFLSWPSGILIGELTKKWRDKLPDAQGLANAGKWIGIIERLIILLLLLEGQFGTIGFLIAAKSFLRFNENNRTEVKTEYLLIGTLISIALAIITGVITLKIIG